MIAKYFLLMAAILVGLGWTTRLSPGSSERIEMAAIETKPSLTAVLSEGREPGTVVVEYRNGTTAAVRVNAQVFGNSILSLEIWDANGKYMPTVSPPVPWRTPEWVVIPAGGVECQEYNYTHGYCPRLPPGRYQVRSRYSGWVAEPLAVTVEPEPPRGVYELVKCENTGAPGSD